MEIIKISQEKTLEKNEDIVSLSLLKEYLRISHNEEDNKIRNIIESCISDFEEFTNYYLRPLTFDLRFTYDDTLRGSQRDYRTYGDAFSPNSNYDYRDLYWELQVPINSINEKSLSKISFLRRDLATSLLTDVEVSQADIQKLNEAVFMTKLRDSPSKLKIQFNNETAFSIFSTETDRLDHFIFRLSQVPGFIPEQIKNGILKNATRLYEFPDTEISQELYLNYSMLQGL